MYNYILLYAITILCLDLRAAAQTPPGRLNLKSPIREEDTISRSNTPVNGNKASGAINCKRSSLATLGLSRVQYSTQFDEIIEVHSVWF